MSGPPGFANSQDVFRFKHAKVEELLTFVLARGGEIYFSDSDTAFEVHPISVEAQKRGFIRINHMPEAGLRMSLTNAGYERLGIAPPLSALTKFLNFCFSSLKFR